MFRWSIREKPEPLSRQLTLDINFNRDPTLISRGAELDQVDLKVSLYKLIMEEYLLDEQLPYMLER